MKKTEEQELQFRNEVELLRRLVWRDFAHKAIGDDKQEKNIDEEKLLKIIKSRSWTLKELSMYLAEHYHEFVKEED